MAKDKIIPEVIYMDDDISITADKIKTTNKKKVKAEVKENIKKEDNQINNN